MIRYLFTAAAMVAVLASGLVGPAPASAVSSPGVRPCAAKWRAGTTVAVRRPRLNEGAVATTRSPVVRYLYRGELVTSCVVAVGRGGWSVYRECGGGHLWQVVPGGQVPRGCLRRQ